MQPDTGKPARRAEETPGLYELIFRHSRDIVLFLRRDDGRILEANEAASLAYGYDHDELLSLTIHDLRSPETDSLIPGQMAEAEAHGLLFETVHCRKDRSTFPVEVSSRAAQVGDTVTLISIVRDITDRKRAQGEARTTVEFLRLVNESESTDALVERAVTFFLAQSGCEAVGIRLRQGEDFPYYEARGFPAEFLLLDNQLCKRDSSGRVRRDSNGDPVVECMCGNILFGRVDSSKPFFTTAGSFWTNSTTRLLATTTDTDRRTRTRNRCNSEGYESVALVPLLAGKERIGLLQLNDRRKGVFSAETIALWERLAGYLAVALAKTQADEALRASEQRYAALYDRSPFAISLSKMPEAIVVSVNDAFLRLFGFEREELVGRTSPDLGISDPDSRARIAAELAQNGSVRDFECSCVTKSGAVRFLSLSLDWVSIGGQQHILTTARDVTEWKRAEEALRESEEGYRALFEHASDAILVTDPAVPGTVLSVNPAANRLFGYSADEFVGLDRQSHIDTTDPGLSKLLVGREDQRTAVGELTCRRKDGTTFPAESATTLLTDRRGRRRSVAIIRDITERKRAESVRQTTLQRFYVVLSSMRSAVLLVTDEGQVEFANPAFCHLFGLKDAPADLVGLGFGDVIEKIKDACLHPDEAVARMREILERGAAVVGEELAVRHGRTCLRDFVPLMVQGRSYGRLWLHFEITERKRAEEELRRSEQRWNAAIEHFGEGAIIVTEAEQVIYWNPAARTLHGFTSDQEGIGPLKEMRSTFQLWTADGSRLLTLDEWPMRRIKRGETVRRWELRLRRPDQGWERIVSYSGAMVGTASGERLIFLSVYDLTDQRKAEMALLEADRQKNQFLAVLSHELRNPLTPIKNSLFILGRAVPDGEQANRARAVIERQVSHLVRLVDDLLDVTRIVSGKLRLRRARFDLAQMLRRTADDHRAMFLDANIDFDVRADRQPVWMDGDETRMAQAVGNLLGNSVKFTEQGGRVLLALEVDAATGTAVIRVRDTGVGVHAELLARLFEPFVQDDSTLDRSKSGLGLGLALVKSVIELHGGTVAVQSEGPGAGAEFLMRVPIEQQPVVLLGTAEHSSDRSRPRRVLVIEDNVDAADSLKEALELGAHEVVVAYDGPEGIKKAQGFDADVVLCDIGLPEMSGYEVAKAFRTDERLRSTYLVALTGYTQAEDLQRATEAGFDAHLAKPPSFEKIEEVLRGLPVRSPDDLRRRARVPRA